jgi:hypothetical protein
MWFQPGLTLLVQRWAGMVNTIFLKLKRDQFVLEDGISLVLKNVPSLRRFLVVNNFENNGSIKCKRLAELKNG